MSKVFLFWLCFVLAQVSFAQKQLLVLKKEKVLLRLNFGDPIVFRLKGDKQIKRSYLNNVYDTAFKVHADTISFRQVDRIYFKRDLSVNTLGGVLVTAGAGYFLIDQLNELTVRGNGFKYNPDVARSAVIMVSAGLPLMLVKKRSQRIRYPSRLLMAKKGSPFYVPPRNGNQIMDFPDN